MTRANPRHEFDVRMNRAVDWIEENLASGPTVAGAAKAAGFSAFHFHRLFSAYAGETVGQFASRLRLERAAARLLDRLDEPVTDLALSLGFSSPSTFARSFRSAFGMTASEWRAAAEGRRSNARETRKPPTAPEPPTVRLEDWPELRIAYVRHVGPYAGDDELFDHLFARLRRWAEPLGQVHEATKWLSLYHDPPGITDDERLRVSVGLELPEAALTLGGEVACLEVGAGRWAIAAFDLLPDEYAAAWASVYAGWLPGSGYQPAHRPAIEQYPPQTSDRPPSERTGSQRVEVCIPVESLGLR